MLIRNLPSRYVPVSKWQLATPYLAWWPTLLKMTLSRYSQVFTPQILVHLWMGCRRARAQFTHFISQLNNGLAAAAWWAKSPEALTTKSIVNRLKSMDHQLLQTIRKIFQRENSSNCLGIFSVRDIVYAVSYIDWEWNTIGIDSNPSLWHT